MSESIADLKAHIERLKGERSVDRLELAKVIKERDTYKAAVEYYADAASTLDYGKIARDALVEAAKCREAK